jgi:hypothetical protein
MKTDNELIAEFMGYKYYGWNHPEVKGSGGGWKSSPNSHPKMMGSGYLTPRKDGLRYDTSWDWLMPVVDKIERSNFGEFHFRLSISGDSIQLSKYSDGSGYLFLDHLIFGKGKIDSTYNAVVKFIQWYNQQNKP